MSFKPLISIIIPARNEENYIGKCLESIFSQDFDKGYFEVIVVNDGSSDCTSNIASQFPVVLTRESRVGCIYALVKGLSLSRGEIIVFTDADCYYPKNWIRKIKTTFKSSPKVMAVGGPSYFHDGGVILDGLSFLLQIFSRRMRGANFAIRKNFLMEIGGLNTDINFGWDTDLFTRIQKYGCYKIDRSNSIYTSARRYKRMFLKIIILQLVNNLFLKAFSRGVIFHFPKLA